MARASYSELHGWHVRRGGAVSATTPRSATVAHAYLYAVVGQAAAGCPDGMYCYFRTFISTSTSFQDFTGSFKL